MKILDWLQLAFIVLKLCNAITWPWWQVMLPYILLYGVPALVMVIGWALIAGDHVLSWIWDRLWDHLPQRLRDWIGSDRLP